MKKINLVCCVVLFMFCGVTAGFAIEFNTETVSDAEKRERFALEKATQAIAFNQEVLVFLYRTLQDKTYWNIAVADKIIDQPIAVIKLMALTNAPVGQLCPRPAYYITSYDMDDYYLERRIEHAIAELRSFALLDRKEENIRAECLEANEQALAVLKAKK